jgi:hypothetical protein
VLYIYMLCVTYYFYYYFVKYLKCYIILYILRSWKVYLGAKGNGIRLYSCYGSGRTYSPLIYWSPLCFDEVFRIILLITSLLLLSRIKRAEVIYCTLSSLCQFYNKRVTYPFLSLWKKYNVMNKLLSRYKNRKVKCTWILN